jgi:alcohol dehydrogenase, propanol-preferring
VPWLHWTCGACDACRRGDENLCERARFTGWTVDGGYADFMLADEAYVVRLPDTMTDVEVAPLLCAGVIGYRALRRAEIEAGENVALVGFGSSAHIAIQVLHHWGCRVAVLTRGGEHQALARDLGAEYVGEIADVPPFVIDRAVNFTPAGETVPRCLDLVRPGGTISLAGIHMSTIPAFEYHQLWGERTLRSVANMTRRDAQELVELAAAAGISTEVESFPLERAPDALIAVKQDRVRGAAVIEMSR